MPPGMGIDVGAQHLLLSSDGSCQWRQMLRPYENHRSVPCSPNDDHRFAMVCMDIVVGVVGVAGAGMGSADVGMGATAAPLRGSSIRNALLPTPNPHLPSPLPRPAICVFPAHARS